MIHTLHYKVYSYAAKARSGASVVHMAALKGPLVEHREKLLNEGYRCSPILRHLSGEVVLRRRYRDRAGRQEVSDANLIDSHQAQANEAIDHLVDAGGAQPYLDKVEECTKAFDAAREET